MLEGYSTHRAHVSGDLAFFIVDVVVVVTQHCSRVVYGQLNFHKFTLSLRNILSAQSTEQPIGY